MSQLLILGTSILAQAPLIESEDSIQSSDAVYPKIAIDGYRIVEASLPNGFSCHEYQFINDAIVKRYPDPPSKEEYNAPILASLQVIDSKSIRALREGDSQRIAALENQAIILRGKLL